MTSCGGLRRMVLAAALVAFSVALAHPGFAAEALNRGERPDGIRASRSE